MLYFLPREQTVGLTLICLVWYFLIYINLRQAKQYPFTISKSQYNISVILVLVLCLFFFSISDWFGYYKEYLIAKEGSYTHLESVYEWLALTIAPNYLIWRLIVWGGALMLLLVTIKRLPIPRALCLLVFIVMAVSRFAYTRTCLAYSIMFFGCLMFYKPVAKHKLLSSIVAIAIVGSSYFFHKSALFGIAMIAFAIAIKRMDWKMGLLFVLFVPVLLFLLRNQIADFLVADFEIGNGDFGDNMSVGQAYLGRSGNRHRGLGQLLSDFLRRSPIYIIALLSLFQANNNNIPKEIRFFMRVLVFIVIASLLCLLDLGASTYVLYYRFLNFGIIPAVFCFSYLYSNKYYPKALNIVYVLSFLGTIYELLYVVYVRYVNGIETYGF